MPGTVDDFMARFGGQNTVTDQDAAQLHDRFVSTHPNDQEFDAKTYHDSATEYLGKLPDDQFHSAASNAIAQAPPEERKGLLGSLMGALGGGGAGAAAGGIGGLASMLGLGSTNPSQMSNDDATKVMNYARQQQPQALRQVVEEKPWFMKALGNPMVMGALTMAAAKMMSNRSKGSSGGLF